MVLHFLPKKFFLHKTMYPLHFCARWKILARNRMTHMPKVAPQGKFMKLSTIAALLLGASLAISSFSAPKAEEVYMIRGFADVFSAGINQMTSRLRRQGIKARSLSTGDWKGVAKDIIRRKKSGKVSFPIIIAGHSLGGVDAPQFANALGRAGIPVALVIGLDPGFPEPQRFGRGAKKVINYKIPSGQNYRRGAGFKGSIRNINISGVDHVGIDKSPKVQNMVISQIRRHIRRR